jgi:limonene-1,2-epoxide hydrolase
MGADQEQVALAFLAYASGQQQDAEGLIAMMSDDIVWQPNVPSTPRVGRDAARAEIERQNAMATGLLPRSEIKNVASNDRAVFVERVDIFEMGGKEITLHINGVLEIEDGKVVAWREYFDNADLASQLGVEPSVIASMLRTDAGAGD